MRLPPSRNPGSTVRLPRSSERTTCRGVVVYRNAWSLRRCSRTFGDFFMTISTKILAAALMAAAAPWLVAPAAAAPMSSPLGLQNALAPSIETVQYRRGWRGGYYRHGGPVGAGLGLAGAGLGLAGAIVGGAIVGATRPFGYYDG